MLEPRQQALSLLDVLMRRVQQASINAPELPSQLQCSDSAWSQAAGAAGSLLASGAVGPACRGGVKLSSMRKCMHACSDDTRRQLLLLLRVAATAKCVHIYGMRGWPGPWRGECACKHACMQAWGGKLLTACACTRAARCDAMICPLPDVADEAMALMVNGWRRCMRAAQASTFSAGRPMRTSTLGLTLLERLLHVSCVTCDDGLAVV